MKSSSATTTTTTTTLVSLANRKDVRLEDSTDENILATFQHLEEDLSTYIIPHDVKRMTIEDIESRCNRFFCV